MENHKPPKKIKKSRFLRSFFYIAIIALIITVSIGIWAYKKFYSPNVDLKGKHSAFIYIPTGSDFEDVKKILYAHDYIVDKTSFEWIAEKKKYVDNIKPGKYELKDGMNDNRLVNMLRSGAQVPVKVTFNNIRTKEKLAGKVSQYLEFDSTTFINLLNNEEYISNFNLTSDEILIMFLPNTYEFWWNTTAEKFIERMQTEYKRFWNEERKQKAKDAGLKPYQVSILASIVQEETNKLDEMSRIAGVYINRLNKNWPLQADPTVKFANGDFTIKRVLNRHLTYESPYNTYLHAGLPPGPICVPNPTTIDKVLNYEKHNYMFFCAKDDLSGYHAFAKTNGQHENNANKYHRALNRMRVR
ncbi:MAG: endolytic transglycosylase MltG [Saprospiraceae bacterium]|nr:endolytic transglycosylase MltG [Saprospiraceae bacterium]